MSNALIFHMCRLDEWLSARQTGTYPGSSQDLIDGFIHFSTATQIVQSARRHRAGQDGLVLLAVDPLAVGPDLKWEISRSGQSFPHLYGALPVTAVHAVYDLPLGTDGFHVFPALE